MNVDNVNNFGDKPFTAIIRIFYNVDNSQMGMA
ncbi:hypothetical protein ING2D1G_1255 [Peptoniphilus sp. ING2-D1G]|nr:hypothetical protein ING2D1G_1255 [Peptoniphilus sp. ING2-D1G]